MYKNKGQIFILFLCLCLWSRPPYEGVCISLVQMSKPVISHIEEEFMLLSVFCFVFALFLNSSFVSFVTISAVLCRLSGFYTNRGSWLTFHWYSLNTGLSCPSLELSKRKLSLSMLTKQRERALLSSKSTYLEKFCPHWLNVVIQEVRLKIVNTQLQCP